MTIDLDSGSGLFDRLGKLIKIIQLRNSHVGGSAATDIPTKVQELGNMFNSGTNGERLAIEGYQEGLVDYQESSEGYMVELQERAQNLLIEMAHADDPLPDKTSAEAIKTLIRQMNTGSETVNASEPTATITYDGGNDGNGIAVISLKNGLGKTRERAIAEDIIARFTDNDAALVEGQYQSESEMSHDYPSGSGASQNLSVIDPSSGGVLSNQGFETWSDPTTPGTWTVNGNVDEESTVFRSGSKSCRVDTGETPHVEQDVAGAIESRTPYLIHVAVRSATGVSATGQITINFNDGTNPLNDEQGSAQQLVIDKADITNSWKSFAAIIQLADPLPSTVNLRVDVDTAFDQAIYIDDVCFGVAASEMYDNGPFVSIIQGTNLWGIDDLITFAITNNDGNGFQRWFSRLFPGVLDLLPSATGGAETIPDSLIS